MTKGSRTSKLGVLLGCLILQSCELSPTEFSEPAGSTHELQKATITDAQQFIALNGLPFLEYQVSSSGTLEADSLCAVTAQLVQRDGRWFLTMDLDVTFPNDGVNALFGFEHPQLRGFAIELDSVEIEEVSSERYDAGHLCPHTRSQLHIATLSDRLTGYAWHSNNDVEANAEVRLTMSEIDESDATMVHGTFQVYGDHSTIESGVIFYSVTGNLTLE